MKKFAPVLCMLFLLAGKMVAAETNSFPVTITVDAGRPLGELKPIWRFFGADEPNYAYMKDGKKLLAELGQLGGAAGLFPRHHLLTSGDGAYALKWGSTSAYKEDANGTPIYDWTINDRIFDTYLERGIKPYVQIGFMPEALTTHPQNYPHHPPVNERADPAARAVVSAEGLREVGRAGLSMGEALRGEIRPGRGGEMVLGSLERTEHQLLARLARRIISSSTIMRWTACAAPCRPRASADRKRPAGRAENFCSEFLEHCAHGTNYVSGKIGSPLDFVSFHAKGSPVFTNGHVRMGMANQLKNMNDAFARHRRRFPNTKTRPSSSANPIPKAAPPAAIRRTPTATARCIPATPPRVFRARWNSRRSTA